MCGRETSLFLYKYEYSKYFIFMTTTFDGIINEPTNDFLGKDGIFWWFGEVRDNADPLQLGRVRVRVIGWYTGIDSRYNQDLPDEDLPWAIVLQPTNQAGNDGTGFSAGQLQKGAMVMGFFMDGQEAQAPVVMGVVRAHKPPGTTDSGVIGSITSQEDLPFPSESATNPATGETVSSGGGPQVSVNQPGNQQLNTAPGQAVTGMGSALPTSSANSGPPITPQPVANAVGGPTTTFETHLRAMLTDIGITASSLIPKGGDFISIVDGTVVNIQALTSKIKNLISGVLAEALAGVKELFLQAISKGLKALKLAGNTGIPFIVTTAIQLIIQIVLKFCCGLDSQWFGGILQGLTAGIDVFVTSLIGQAINSIFTAIESAYDKLVDKILCAINKMFNSINAIIGAVAAAVQVAKTVSDAIKKGTAFFENLEKINIKDISSITSVISLIIGLIPTQCDRTAPGGSDTKSFVPFLGVTDCGFDGSPLGSYGKDCGQNSVAGNANNVISNIIKNADPYLTAVTNWANGSYVAQYSTPGLYMRQERYPSGATLTSTKTDPKVQGEYEKAKAKQKLGEQPAPVNTAVTKDAVVGDHHSYPGVYSMTTTKDCGIFNKANFVQTTDGSYKLKIIGDLDIEVGGRLALTVGGAPQKTDSGKSGGTQGTKSLIRFMSDAEIGGSGKIEMQGVGTTVAAKPGTDVKLMTENLSLNAPSLNINCTNDLKLAAGNAIYVETPSLIRNINFPPLPRVKSGIFTMIGGSYDTILYPSLSGADAIPRYTVNNTAGMISMTVGAGGMFFKVAAGGLVASVAAGAVSISAAAGPMALFAGAAMNLTATAIMTLNAATIKLN